MEVQGFSSVVIVFEIALILSIRFFSFFKILAGEGRECTPNDPKCSWQPAGVKLKGLALRPEAENNELCKDRFKLPYHMVHMYSRKTLEKIYVTDQDHGNTRIAIYRQT